MQVRYLFHPWPASEVKPPESTAWRRVQAERLMRWMDAATPVIGLGFRDRLRDGLGAELPDPALIETSENGAAPVVVPQGPPTWRAFTSRLSSALADFGVFWVFTGNPLTAKAIAGSKFVAQGATGITHDALWSWLAAGSVTSDLPSAGAERPLSRWAKFRLTTCGQPGTRHAPLGERISRSGTRGRRGHQLQLPAAIPHVAQHAAQHPANQHTHFGRQDHFAHHQATQRADTDRRQMRRPNNQQGLRTLGRRGALLGEGRNRGQRDGSHHHHRKNRLEHHEIPKLWRRPAMIAPRGVSRDAVQGKMQPRDVN